LLTGQFENYYKGALSPFRFLPAFSHGGQMTAIHEHGQRCHPWRIVVTVFLILSGVAVIVTAAAAQTTLGTIRALSSIPSRTSSLE
jgi:hypothetical protein